MMMIDPSCYAVILTNRKLSVLFNKTLSKGCCVIGITRKVKLVSVGHYSRKSAMRIEAIYLYFVYKCIMHVNCCRLYCITLSIIYDNSDAAW